MSSIADNNRFTVSHNNRYFRRLTETLAFLSTISIFISAIYMAFFKESSVLSVIDTILNVIYMLDWVLGFFVAYEYDVTHSQIALNYLVKNYSVLDLFSSLPIQVYNLLFNQNKVVYFVLLIRFWRLRKLLAWTSKLEETANPRCFFWIRFLKFTSLALLHIHVWACVFYLLASADVDAQVSWTKGRENFFQLELWSRYITSVYFVTTIYSTVGFGDFHPTTDMEMIVCLVYMALNMGFGAGLFDQFISLVVKLIRPADKDRPSKAKGRGECASYKRRLNSKRKGGSLSSNAGSSKKKSSLESQPKKDKDFDVLVPCAGLRNINNTCFMNAVLQAFTHIVPLHRDLLFFDLKLHTCCSRGVENKFCILCALRKHLTEVGHPSRDTVNPSELYHGLQSFMPEYVKGAHEDSYDFMIKALTALRKCLPPYDNLIDRTFGGVIVNQLRCCSCEKSGKKLNREVFDLSLDISNADDIRTALDIYLGITKPDGPCSFCKKDGFLENKHWLREAPYVVVIHLKRFELDPHSEEYHKDQKTVGFEMDLDMKPYAINPPDRNGDWKYDLCAIVEHKGALLNSGHYICYVRCAGDQWYSMNDAVVEEVPQEAVMSKQAYLLFYVRKGTPLFSSQVLYKADKVELPTHATETTAASKKGGSNESMQKTPREQTHTEENVNESHGTTTASKKRGRRVGSESEDTTSPSTLKAKKGRFEISKRAKMVWKRYVAKPEDTTSPSTLKAKKGRFEISKRAKKVWKRYVAKPALDLRFLANFMLLHEKAIERFLAKFMLLREFFRDDVRASKTPTSHESPAVQETPREKTHIEETAPDHGGMPQTANVQPRAEKTVSSTSKKSTSSETSQASGNGQSSVNVKVKGKPQVRPRWK